jgi:peptidoglycan pentaglycine glycine transferase (the first glycine)
MSSGGYKMHRDEFKVTTLAATGRDRWNTFVSKWPCFVLMQSYEWGEFKERLGWKAIRLAVLRQGQIIASAQLLIKPVPLCLFSVGYVPRGPLVDWENTATTTVLLEGLHQVARRHRALFLRIEPPVLYSSQAHLALQRYGFQATEQTNQPRCTLILDLESAIDTLFASLPKKTRHHIRACERKGVVSRKGRETDLTTFYHLLRATSKRSGFAIHSQSYYEQEFKVFARHNRTALFLADYEGQMIGAEMPFVFGQHGAALHGASGDTHRKLPASDLLTWEGIRWAKNQGCRSYDLWGIPDEVGELVAAGKTIPKDRQDGLWGVYHFKKGFSSNVVYYVGAYDYVYVRPAYAWATRALPWLASPGILTSLMDRMTRRHNVDQLQTRFADQDPPKRSLGCKPLAHSIPG